MKQRYFFFLILLLFFITAVAANDRERLDDSASPRSSVQAPLVLSNTGGLLADSIDATAAITQFGWVHYRLHTAAYQGQRARIYYVIPDLIQGLRSPRGLEVEWQAEPPFRAGLATIGTSTPVWEGVIDGAWLDARLDITWTVQLDQIYIADNQPFGFQAFFEIELIP